MARPQRFCIFCGKPGLTREHVWADWLKRFIPKTAANYSRFVATAHPTHTEFKRKMVSGDLRSQRLKVVCKSCNNGWMSRLQERTKSLLLPFLNGEVTVMDVHQQEILAAWIAMFVMVAEYFDPYKVATPQSERDYLMENQKTPPNWKIWFGDLDEKSHWPSLLAHFAVPISSSEHVPEVMDNGFPRPNTQTMTFRVGRLYVHVRSSMTDIFENWRFARPDMLSQIWPIRRNIVGWPPKSILTARDADAIASAFHLASDEIARRTASGD